MNTPIRVLYVDDNRLDRELVRDALEMEAGEFQVTEATGRADFQRLLASGEWDLVLTDFRIGEFEGLEVIEEVRSHQPGVPVIMLTGTGSEEVAVEALKRGAADYVLKKPQHVRRLPFTLRSALERARAEEALRQSERNYRTLFERIHVGVVVHGSDGEVLTANREAQEMLGLMEDQLTGRLVSKRSWGLVREDGTVVHTSDLPANRVLVTREAIRGLVVALTPRGATGVNSWLAVDADPVLGEVGEVVQVIVTLVDITALKQAEAALRQTQDQLLQSQKMEALGQLAGGIAHDFNNILTIILGYGEMILAAGDECDVDALRGDVEAMRAAAERARKLVRQILAFSRRQALESEVICPNEVVGRVAELVRRTLGEDIDFVTLPSPDLGVAEVDASQLEQALVNMVLNARDAMPHGGRLTIETGELELDEAYCRAHADAVPGSYVMIAVTDNGTGMDKRTKSKVFEPFFTTKEPGRGTGLGLATAYGVVRQSGGSISVESELGKGSVFRIHLPLVARSARTPVAADGRSVSSGGSEAILVVDDEPGVRKLVEKVLKNTGYSVFAVDTGEEALALLRGEQHFDLLLTDMILPGGMRGDALADEASCVRPDLPVAYMSGYAGEWAADTGRFRPGVNYLVKPFNFEELLRFVRAALNVSGLAGG
jgi:PAS domain S-box-containing protein